MKSIFTYPSNSGTNYIDPDYLGDSSEGFTKRVNELRIGTYKAWNGTAPVDTNSTIMKNMSKYNNVAYLEDNGGNNTIYKFWKETLINTTSNLHSYDLDKIKFIPEGGQLVAVLHSDEPLGIYDGQEYDYTGDNWPQFGTNTPSDISVDRLGAIGTSDEDWFYPKAVLTVTGGNFIIGEDYTITTIAPTIDAVDIVTSTVYTIKEVGTTDFTLIGASGNIVGVSFTATGAGTGTGTVYVTNDMTDFTLVGAGNNDIGTQFLCTGAGGGLGTATSVEDTFFQPTGQQESFAIFRDANQLFYAKSDIQGSWDPIYKLPASWINLGISNTWFQDDPSIITNYLMDDPSAGTVGDIAEGYQNAGSLEGIGAQITDMTDIVSGFKYVIDIVGSEDFTLIGASSNTVGEVFTATSTGTQTSGSKVHAIYNNNKVIRLNGPGGTDVSGQSFITLSSDPNDTFPVQLHVGNIDQDNWMEITETSTNIDLQTEGITLTVSQHNTIATYAAGTIVDDGTPIPNAWSNSYVNTYYGFCYANYEVTAGAVTGGSIEPGEYNATDYPENITNWDKMFTWTLVDRGSGTNRYTIHLENFNTWRQARKPAEEFNGYLTVGRKYEVWDGGYGDWASAGATSVSAGSFSTGVKYVIEAVGTTDFTLIGASANTVGTVFTATGAGSGTGTATEAVFTATSAGTYVDLASGYAGIYPNTGTQRPAYSEPDPWNKMKKNKFVDPKSSFSLQLTSSGAVKFRLGFIDPTIYGGDLLTVSDGQEFTGDITIDSSESNRYKLATLDDVLYGNNTYLQRTGESTYVNNARFVPNKYYKPGSETEHTETNWPVLTASTNSSGYYTGGTFDARQPGQFDNGDDKLLTIETVADTYTPPSPTAIELADTWDTDDEWASDGEASAKQWPDHVTPSRAVINYNAPTIVNSSQSGVKYTRSVGHTKWRLEVEYPPMNAEDFQKFHAIAQAAHGQSTPFYFNLNHKDGNPILWKDFYEIRPNVITTPRIKDAITAGDTTMLVEGFASNQTDVFRRGEVFIDGENENGYLHTSLSGTGSNIYGEAKIRTPWPFRTAVATGELIYKNPTHAVVTLGSDNFEYTVDVNNYYYVNVAFDLDSWK